MRYSLPCQHSCAPSTIFEPWVHDRPGGEQRPQGYLIGDDCPSFPSYEAAFRAFFYGDFSGSPGGQVPARFSAIRVVDATAWLERVRITPASLEVCLGGSDVAGVRVELNIATFRCDARATCTGQVTLPLPDGLPPGAWLYVSRDRQWLDYRAIGEYGALAELARAGVEVEVSEDPDSEIRALLSHGEGRRAGRRPVPPRWRAPRHLRAHPGRTGALNVRAGASDRSRDVAGCGPLCRLAAAIVGGDCSVPLGSCLCRLPAWLQVVQPVPTPSIFPGA